MSRSAVGSRSSDRRCAFTPTQHKPCVGHRRGVPPSDGRLQTTNRRSSRRISRAKGKSLALGAALRHAGRQAIAERGDPLNTDRQPAPWGRAARRWSSTAPGPIGNSSRALERREGTDRPRESRSERNAHAWRIEAAADLYRCRVLAGPRRVRCYAGMNEQGRAPSPAGRWSPWRTVVAPHAPSSGARQRQAKASATGNLGPREKRCRSRLHQVKSDHIGGIRRRGASFHVRNVLLAPRADGNPVRRTPVRRCRRSAVAVCPAPPSARTGSSPDALPGVRGRTRCVILRGPRRRTWGRLVRLLWRCIGWDWRWSPVPATTASRCRVR